MTTGGKPRLLGISKRGNKYLRKLVTAAAFDKGSLYRILRNRVYVGLAVHKGVAYPGEHRAIISQSLWDKVQSILKESPRMRACRSRAATPALLKGLLFGPCGRAMSPTHTRRGR